MLSLFLSSTLLITSTLSDANMHISRKKLVKLKHTFNNLICISSKENIDKAQEIITDLASDESRKSIILSMQLKLDAMRKIIAIEDQSYSSQKTFDIFSAGIEQQKNKKQHQNSIIETDLKTHSNTAATINPIRPYVHCLDYSCNYIKQRQKKSIAYNTYTFNKDSLIKKVHKRKNFWANLYSYIQSLPFFSFLKLFSKYSF
jgi:hypothetical protein